MFDLVTQKGLHTVAGRLFPERMNDLGRLLLDNLGIKNKMGIPNRS